MSRGTLVTMAGAAAVLLAGCANLLAGKPVSVYDDPFQVAGMPATDGPSGVRADAPRAVQPVTGGNGGDDDELAALAIGDIEEFWARAYNDPLPGRFAPVNGLVSWDSNGLNERFCDDDTFGLVNSAFCPLDDTIGWDRGQWIPQLRKEFGDMAIAMVLGHEYGHSIQHQARLIADATPTLVAEQQADCFAGVYVRWVAEGNSKRFMVSTGDGLNRLLAALISFRDPPLSTGDTQMHGNEHGSAFDRISAFQSGFTDGAPVCARIDEQEIAQRRGNLPMALQQNGADDWPVTEESVRTVTEALSTLFAPAAPPQLRFDTASCTDARPHDPVYYCPASNTVFVDVPRLAQMGAPTDGDTGLPVGDYTAYSALTSRFMLAIQHGKPGVVLDNARAALRTACLTGVAITRMSRPVTVPSGTTVAPTAGDVDEVVSGILTNGLVAGDVNGDSVPSGFSRIDAFRAGVLGDEERCFKRYP